MGQLVHQDQCRTARQGGIEIKFLQNTVFVDDVPAREYFHAVQQSRGFRTAMGLHHADNDVNPLAAHLLPGRQHSVGLAYAGRGTEKDFELAALRPLLFGLQLLQKLVRVRTTIRHGGKRLMPGVKRKVEFQHVDPRLAEDPPLPFLCVLGDQATHGLFIKPARLGNATHLI